MNGTAIKTKKAPILWDNSNKVTCKYYGDKDAFGKAIWYDEAGHAYELIYARRGGQYSFNPYKGYDKQ